MNDVYTMKIAGLERHLPLCPVNKNLDIAAFVMFSDVELTIACASELIKKHRRPMLLSLPNRRAFPLAYEMARQLGIKYIVARKSTKLYMKNPIAVNVKSITTANLQTLYLDSTEAEYLSGKRVLIVDDVISTVNLFECFG